ncbi:MAG: hypothetical protein JWN03_7990 [Nocardia sp.]|uniref:hypothetical protein n=1 Tax=Nocardia sp. TaxID=1821 RepID=UPI0026376E57|nr:hypothetical protein [Nocardia sp.]MCU1647715.1 hypothetical protein [Nocardia sp.]
MTDLLAMLVRPAGTSQHIMTLGNGWSTAIERLDDDSYSIEYPAALAELRRILDHGEETSLILRTFTQEISHTLPNGTSIPIKEVRGWCINEGVLHPLSGQQMFDASCTDADTGEPIAPERAVRYIDAYAVELGA